MTEREKYIDDLKNKIGKAAKAKKFVGSEEGGYVIEFINTTVSTLTNKLINKRVERDEYIELRAQIDILRKLKQVLEVEASTTAVTEWAERLKAAESGE